jgi:transposase InsO family protein
MSERQEFIVLACGDGANMRQLCRRFGISPTTGYKWLARFKGKGPSGLVDLSRRPKSSPIQTSAKVEQAVVKLRMEHPAWGGRKLQARLKTLTKSEPPSPSTITAILHRHDLIDPPIREHRAYERFEHPHPNDLWQMDFKGYFALEKGRCHPLTVLDDHSRFALGLFACGDQTTFTVKKALTDIFRRYGMPYRMSMDNGSPWAVVGRKRHWTQLSVWFLRLGIRPSFARPYHPQTNGKDERFHRTLKCELLGTRAWRSLDECQHAFGAWRQIYNCERPHQAIGFDVPASRYQISPRSFPEHLPKIDYPGGTIVRKVEINGTISLKQREYFVGEAFRGLHVALRHTTVDGKLDVYFLQQKIASIDLRSTADDHLKD